MLFWTRTPMWKKVGTTTLRLVLASLVGAGIGLAIGQVAKKVEIAAGPVGPAEVPPTQT